MGYIKLYMAADSESVAVPLALEMQLLYHNFIGSLIEVVFWVYVWYNGINWLLGLTF